MKIFPSKEYSFKLSRNEEESLALERLSRKTEESDFLISKLTDKTFIGTVNGNSFKLISSFIGFGAFCVLKGEIRNGEGWVSVEVHKTFKILISIILILPLVGILASFLTSNTRESPLFFIIGIGQVLMIRFAFIGLAFKFLSESSMQRLRDVLDVVMIENRTNED